MVPVDVREGYLSRPIGAITCVFEVTVKRLFRPDQLQRIVSSMISSDGFLWRHASNGAYLHDLECVIKAYKPQLMAGEVIVIEHGVDAKAKPEPKYPQLRDGLVNA
jgi:hypothetical protein